MLGGILVELQQHIGVVDDLGDRLGVLGAVVDLERLDRHLSMVDVFGVVDLPQRRERTRARRLRQRGKITSTARPLRQKKSGQFRGYAKRSSPCQ
jgi:hypothetical protein